MFSVGKGLCGAGKWEMGQGVVGWIEGGGEVEGGKGEGEGS